MRQGPVQTEPLQGGALGLRISGLHPASLPLVRLGYLREPILFCLRLSGGRPPPPFLENPNKMYL